MQPQQGPPARMADPFPIHLVTAAHGQVAAGMRLEIGKEPMTGHAGILRKAWPLPIHSLHSPCEPAHFHENHETRFMVSARDIAHPAPHNASSPCTPAGAPRCSFHSFFFHPTTQESQIMKWETPTAIDLRFGFEITMYVFNR